MWEIIVLTSENKKFCPFFRYTVWEEATNFIKIMLEQGYSCEINKYDFHKGE